MSSARRNEIKSAVALATRLSWVFIVIAAAGIALFRPAIYTPGAVLFVAGVSCYAVLLLSWHYYRPNTSVYAWLLFSIAIAMSIFAGLVLPTVREGFCIHSGRSRRSWVAWGPALRCRSLSLRQDCATGRTNDTINAGAHP